MLENKNFPKFVHVFYLSTRCVVESLIFNYTLFDITRGMMQSDTECRGSFIFTREFCFFFWFANLNLGTVASVLKDPDNLSQG